jgi:hypothetical protein
MGKCCKGASCCSCTISLLPIGIRTCGQAVFPFGEDYFCVLCSSCNSNQPPCNDTPTADADAEQEDSAVQNVNINAFNPSYSSYGIFKTKNDIINKQLDSIKDKIYLYQAPKENILYFIPPILGIDPILDKWSNLNQLSIVQKRTLYKTLVSSTIRNNNANLDYNIYLKLINKGLTIDSGDLNVLIETQLAYYLENLLINTTYSDILQTYTFDQLFRLIYNYLILHMNIDKYFLIFHIGGYVLSIYGIRNSQNIVN